MTGADGFAAGPRRSAGLGWARVERFSTSQRLPPLQLRQSRPARVPDFPARGSIAREARVACRIVDLERLQLQVEHGRDFDKVGWPERFTESGRRPVGARRDLVGVEFAYRASRNGPQCRRRCPVGGLVVDVQIAAVRYIDDARLQIADCTLDGANDIRQGDRVAAVLRKSDKLRRLSAERGRRLVAAPRRFASWPLPSPQRTSTWTEEPAAACSAIVPPQPNTSSRA